MVIITCGNHRSHNTSTPKSIFEIMSNNSGAYHYTPAINHGDPASELALGHYRTFINTLTLDAIDLATSPDDAPHEVATYLNSHQTELDLAFHIFANVFRLLGTGALNPVDEGFPLVSTAGDNSLTTGNSDPTSSALNGADVSSTVDPAPATSNNIGTPASDAQLDAVAAALTRAATQRPLDASSRSPTEMTASTQQISIRNTAQVNGTGTHATMDASGDADRPAESDGLPSVNTDSLPPATQGMTGLNGNGSHNATEELAAELSDIALEDDNSSVAPTDHRGSEDDASRASSATGR
jgi:hypothetical protein